MCRMTVVLFLCCKLHCITYVLRLRHIDCQMEDSAASITAAHIRSAQEEVRKGAAHDSPNASILHALVPEVTPPHSDIW